MEEIYERTKSYRDHSGRKRTAGAKSKGMPRNYGHTVGAKNVENICKAANDLGVKYLTLYAFSTENWNRPESEVAALMKLS